MRNYDGRCSSRHGVVQRSNTCGMNRAVLDGSAGGRLRNTGLC